MGPQKLRERAMYGSIMDAKLRHGGLGDLSGPGVFFGEVVNLIFEVLST